jgi:carbonic anhydrase
MFDKLLESNGRYAASFPAGHLDARPVRHLAVVTCMDARIDAHGALGLQLGDAHVVRNAGGRASDDAIRSLVFATHLLGVDHIAVIHHTNCGAGGNNRDQLHDIIGNAGLDPDAFDFLLIDDQEQSVRDDVALIEASPLLPDGLAVAGFIYDVDNGKLSRVV